MSTACLGSPSSLVARPASSVCSLPACAQFAHARLCSPPLPLAHHQLPVSLPSPPTRQGKGCGFVQFVLRTAAERAMTAMNGQVLGASAMRISWGRSSSRVANQAQQQAGMGGPYFPGMHAHAPFGMPGPFDPAAAAAMGAYQLGGMPGGDPYAAAAFGMQPQPDAAMFQVYQQANGAALSSLMRPNGMGPGGPPTQSGPPPQQPGAASGNPSGGATSAHVPAPAPASGSSAPQPVMNGKQAATPAAEGDGVVAVDKDGNGEEGEPRCGFLAASLMLPCC